MTYDFTTILDRRGHDATALDSMGLGGGAPDLPAPGFDPIPMWVADMNFPVLPTITEAIERRLREPHFGYFEPRQEYLDAIVAWQRDRNGVEDLSPEHIGYENGVLGGVVSAIEAFYRSGRCRPCAQPHLYRLYQVHRKLRAAHCALSRLCKTLAGVWRMDYADMERKLVEEHIHAAVFCSPHNPVGRVWERAEIETAMELFRAHDCVVVSDEIWSDIIMPGHRHVPTQSVFGGRARAHRGALCAEQNL